MVASKTGIRSTASHSQSTSSKQLWRDKICHQFAMTSVCHCSIVLLLHKQSFTLTLESNQNLTDSKQKFLYKCDLSVKCQAVSNLAFIIRMQPVKCKNTWVVLIGAHLLWLLRAYKLGLGAVICKFSSVCLRGVAVRLPASHWVTSWLSPEW